MSLEAEVWELLIGACELSLLVSAPVRRCDEREAASICLLVCWCIDRWYELRSAGGVSDDALFEKVSWWGGMVE